jgi:hypothetical protein
MWTFVSEELIHSIFKFKISAEQEKSVQQEDNHAHALKMEVIYYSETSIRKRTIRRYVPVDNITTAVRTSNPTQCIYSIVRILNE